MEKNGENNWATSCKLCKYTIEQLFALIILALLSADFFEGFIQPPLERKKRKGWKEQFTVRTGCTKTKLNERPSYIKSE